MNIPLAFLLLFLQNHSLSPPSLLSLPPSLSLSLSLPPSPSLSLSLSLSLPPSLPPSLSLSLSLQPKILDAHDDKVRSMTYTDNDLVISGSGSSDGYANVWKLMNWFDE